MQHVRNRMLYRIALSITLCCALWLLISPPTDALLINLGYSALRSLDHADPIDHDLAIEVDPERMTARFTDEFSMKARSRTSTIYVILGRDYKVDRITNDVGASLSFGPYADWQFLNLPFVIYRIQLPQALQAGQSTTLRFEYHVSPETVSQFNPFLSAELLFLNVGMFWYPQMPGEGFFDASITLHAPDGWTMIAEGAPVEPSAEVRWETAAPVPGLGLIAGRFEPVESFIEPWHVVGWRVGGRDRHLDEMMQYTAEALSFFTDRLGPIDLERFDVVELPSFMGGSIAQLSGWMYTEYVSLVGIGNSYLRAYAAGHEVAHKWIGYTAGLELLGTSWVSEGLTDYLAFLFVEATHGTEAMRHVIEERAIRPLSERTGSMRSLSSIQATDLQTGDGELVFQKGSLVFRALHRRLGDEAFFAGLREFVDRYRHQHASASDFLRVMSEVSKQDLRTFERDWVNGTQRLDYSLADVSVTPTETAYRISFRVVSNGRLVEPRPADVAIHLEDGTVFRIGVQPTGDLTSFTFRTPIVKVELDPDYWLPDWNREGHVWIAD